MRQFMRAAGLFFTVTAAGACGRARMPAPIAPAGSAGQAAAPQDPSAIFNRMGLLAVSAPVMFTAKVSYFAASTADSTIVLTSVAIPNRTLTFTREGNNYRAPYEVRLRIMQGPAEVRTVDALELVRVSTFKETTRSDESVIFQNYQRLRPGTYTISVNVRDAGSTRSASQEGTIVVPPLRSGQLSTPVMVYRVSPRASLDSVPRLLVSPRSSAIFGQDSAISVYLEAYGSAQRVPVVYRVQADRGAVQWRDSVVLQRRGGLLSGSVAIPISRVGVGITNITFQRADAPDTVRIPVFVSFGQNLPVLSFEDVLFYLRYFATPDRIAGLRNTPADQRGRAWAEFLRATDPAPATPEHEGLQAYFGRIELANARFRDEGTRNGWLSDRGKVFVTLGEPDQVFEQNVNTGFRSVSSRGRVQYWEYGQYRIRLVFYDEAGIGRWRLTTQSESEFLSTAARVLVR